MYSVVLMAALTTCTSAPDCWFKHGCGGCYGGYGGCYGCYGCSGWCGGGYGCGGYACHGGYGCYGGCYGCGGYVPMYSAPFVPQMGVPSAPEPAPRPKEDKSALPSRARLIVELPADARLFIDDQLMKTTSERRVFNTPTLDAGQAYYYVLRAEIVREGKTYTDIKQVVIRPGGEVQTSFSQLEVTAAAGKPQATARR